MKLLVWSYLVLSFDLAPVTLGSVINNETVRSIVDIMLPYIKVHRLQLFPAKPRCFGSLGCFSNKGLFQHPIWRPLSLLPEHPDSIGTKFELFTRVDQQYPEFISEKNFTKSSFNRKRRTIVAIHGFYYDNFFGLYQKESFGKLKKALFYREPVNFIFVNWGRGSTTWYLQATSNTRVVGAQIASLINKIMANYKIPPNELWVIGHSLGSHVAGYVGKIIKNIGRITGLDPAKPYFTRMDKDVRLDPTDALFVDVIHTNSPQQSQPFGFGVKETTGHLDFYPNGGNSQPGCKEEQINSFYQGLQFGIQSKGICNHQRSIDFFSESLYSPKCEMIGWKCVSYESFLQGDCYSCGQDKKNCSRLGQIKEKFMGDKFYLLTSYKSPYCVHHSRVVIKLSQNGFSGGHKAKCSASLIGHNLLAKGQSIELNLKPGISFSLLVIGDAIPVPPRVELEFKDKDLNLISPSIESVEIIPMGYFTDDQQLTLIKKLDPSAILVK